MKRPDFSRWLALLVSLLLFLPMMVQAQNAPVVISMWHISPPADPFHRVLQGAIDNFNASQSAVRIEARAVENAAYKAQIAQAIANDQQPDIFQTWGGGNLNALVQAGAVRPIAQLKNSSLFIPAALAPSTFNGEHYAVPANLAGVFLWYNRDLFAQHQVTPPTTWEQLLAACRTFRAANVTPVALGNREQWPGSFWHSYLMLRLGGVTTPLDLDGATAVSADQQLQEAVNAGCFETNYNRNNFTDAQAMLANGQAAMQLQGDWNWATLKAINPGIAQSSIDVMRFPLLENGVEHDRDFLGGTGQAFAVSSAAPPETEAVLSQLLSSESYGKAVAEAGFIPALTGYEQFIADDVVREMATALSDANSIQLFYDQLLPPEQAQAYLQTTYDLLQGSIVSAETQPLSAAALELIDEPLHELAASRNIPVGSAVSVEPLRNDAQYAELLRQEFNLLTPEIALKWDILRPDQETYNFSDADFIIDYAINHEMQVRGHTLIWHVQLPNWLENGSFSRDELLAMMREHITTVVSRYKGRVYAWDVVNEALNADGSLRDSIWLRTIGPEYIDYAFQWAREADPDALLFYNDFDIEGLSPKSDAMYALVSSMKERGIPIDGVGFQTHWSLAEYPSPEAVAQNMQRFSDLGLQVQITEMDVAIQDGTGDDQARLQQQAGIYSAMAGVCLRNPSCTAFVTWGFTDRHTWIPQETGSPDQPLLFDSNYQPKPAYYALAQAFAQR
jgi:endo-1,4-beta-xylanase